MPHSAAPDNSPAAGRTRTRIALGVAASAAAAAIVPTALAGPAAAAQPAAAAGSADATYQAVLAADAVLPFGAQVYEQVGVRSMDYRLPPGDRSAPIGQRDEMVLRRIRDAGSIDPGSPHYVYFGTDLPEAFSTPSLETSADQVDIRLLDPATLEPTSPFVHSDHFTSGSYDMHTEGPVGPFDGWGTVSQVNPNPLGSVSSANLPELLRSTFS